MGRYILRRLLQSIPVVVVSTFVVFMVTHLIPGDAATVLAGPNATPETLAAIRKDMGLDQPLVVQYAVWVAHIFQGDLGKSTLSGQPIAKLLQARAPATIELTVAAMVISMLLALPLGILSATHVRGRLEWLISTVQSLWLAIPNFWAGILAIILFSLILRWLPPGGRVADWNDIGGSIKSLESALHEPIESYAYPSGRFNRETLAIVREERVPLAVTTDSSNVISPEDALQLTRVRVHGAWNLKDFDRSIQEAFNTRHPVLR